MICLRPPAPAKPLPGVLEMEWKAEGSLVLSVDGRLVLDARNRKRAAYVVALQNAALKEAAS